MKKGVPTLRVHNVFKKATDSLKKHSSWFRANYPCWVAIVKARTDELRQRWQALKETERLYVTILLFMAGFICVQFMWVIALQVQVSKLSSQTEIQEIRIAQLEQAVRKHNDILYSTSSVVWDIQEKWSDLNFRVMQNTWKLDK